MQFLKLLSNFNTLLKSALTSNLILWLVLDNTVLSVWNNRNLNSTRAGGVKIGAFDRSYKSNHTGRIGAGVLIGGKGSLKPKEIFISREEPNPFNKSIGEKSVSHVNVTDLSLKSDVKVFKLRLILPYKSFGFREYNKATSSALNTLKRGSAKKSDFFRRYDIETQIETLTMTPSPISK